VGVSEAVRLPAQHLHRHDLVERQRVSLQHKLAQQPLREPRDRVAAAIRTTMSPTIRSASIAAVTRVRMFVAFAGPSSSVRRSYADWAAKNMPMPPRGWG
jgi:hypothetical protein